MNETAYLISEAAKQAGVESHVLRYWEEELKLPIARNKMGHRYYTKQDIQIFLAIKELKKRGFQLKMIRELIPKLEEEAPFAATISEKEQEGISKKIQPLEIPVKETKVTEIKVKEAKIKETKGDERKGKDTNSKVGKQPEVAEVARPEAVNAEVAKAEVAVTEVDKLSEEIKTVHSIAMLSQESRSSKENLPVSRNKKYQKGKKNGPKIVNKQQVQKIPIQDIKKDRKIRKTKETHQEEFYQIMERLFHQLSKEDNSEDVSKDRSEDRYKRLDAAIRKQQYSRRMVAATEEQGKKRKKKYSNNK